MSSTTHSRASTVMVGLDAAKGVLSMNGTWFTVPNNGERKLPQWQRMTWVSDTGMIFVPAVFSCQAEGAVVVRALYDGVAMIEHAKHAYVPSAWLAKEYPFCKDLCVLIEQKIAVVHDEGDDR